MTLSGWVEKRFICMRVNGLNPSFSGWPSLGQIKFPEKYRVKLVLIPLLVDDPLWVFCEVFMFEKFKVLIPLLVDDPLWDAGFHGTF